MNRRNTPRISFIGFGEAGQAIASGLRDAGVERIAAWDILFPEQAGAHLKAAGEAIGVHAAASAADAVREADLVISAVTAASSVDAARSVAPHLNNNPYYLDINSVSPGRKQETAKLLGKRARYVDVAVVAAIHPARHRTPLLIAGPHAEKVSPLLRELGVDPLMVESTVARQREMGAIGKLETVRAALKSGRAAILGAINAAAKNRH